VTLDSECVECRYVLATVYMARSELDRAEQELTQVITISPDYSFAHNALASVFINLGRPAEAVEHARRASDDEDFSGRHLAYYNLGWAQAELGRPDEALEALGMALRENAGMCLARFRIAEIYVSRQRYDDALARLEMALESGAPNDDSSVPPDDGRANRNCEQLPDLYHLRGLALIGAGRAEEAGSAFRQCVEIATEHSELGRRCTQQMELQENDGEPGDIPPQ